MSRTETILTVLVGGFLVTLAFLALCGVQL
jgi:hypothetical protein